MRGDRRNSFRKTEDTGMRSLASILMVAIALVALVGQGRAGGLDRVGTAGAQELRIPMGPASIALGGAAVALGGGLSNIFWNPASLAATDNSEAMVSYSTYLADSKVNYGAISTGMGSAGMVALTVKVLNVGDITVTTEDASEGTGQILSPNFGVFGLTYGRRMTDRVLLGVTGNFVNERVADVTANGFALDLGLQYDTGWRGLRFGFAMKNVGPNMHFAGGDLEQRVIVPGDDPSAQPHVVQLESTTFELPSYLQLGAAWGWTSIHWLHRLRQPTLVMHGADDPLVPAVNAELMHALIPHSELMLLDCGHMFLLTRAQRCARAIDEFLH